MRVIYKYNKTQITNNYCIRVPEPHIMNTWLMYMWKSNKPCHKTARMDWTPVLDLHANTCRARRLRWQHKRRTIPRVRSKVVHDGLYSGLLKSQPTVALHKRQVLGPRPQHRERPKINHTRRHERHARRLAFVLNQWAYTKGNSLTPALITYSKETDNTARFTNTSRHI